MGFKSNDTERQGGSRQPRQLTRGGVAWTTPKVTKASVWMGTLFAKTHYYRSASLV